MMAKFPDPKRFKYGPAVGAARRPHVAGDIRAPLPPEGRCATVAAAKALEDFFLGHWRKA